MNDMRKLMEAVDELEEATGPLEGEATHVAFIDGYIAGCDSGDRSMEAARNAYKVWFHRQQG